MVTPAARSEVRSRAEQLKPPAQLIAKLTQLRERVARLEAVRACPDQQQRLFAPFEQLGQARVKGHGLGLSVVRRITDKLGGQVGMDSAPGQGSTFYFTLPAAPSDP